MASTPVAGEDDTGERGAGVQGSADPGIRLLARAGDFITPLTRFARSDIALKEGRISTSAVTIRQTVRFTLSTRRSEATGAPPAGAMDAGDMAGLEAANAAQEAAARAAMRRRIVEWAARRGDQPLGLPTVGDVFRMPPPVTHVAICPACAGAGKVACVRCAGAGVVPCVTCDARGGTPCRTCDSKGRVRCHRCYGVGHLLRDRPDGGQDRITCTGCGGSGETACHTCHGRKSILCATCHGQKKTPCPTCQGAGSQPCKPCGGAGRRHTLAQLTCVIGVSTVVDTAGADPALAIRLKDASAQRALDLAESHRGAIEAGAAGFTREIRATIPVASATLIAAGKTATLIGYGPSLAVDDYANLASILLAADTDRLIAALPQTRNLAQKASAELVEALTETLASPVNVAIVENAAAKDLDTMPQRFSGAVSLHHVRRTAEAGRKAMGRVYLAELARGPAWVLLAPLLALIVGPLVREQDAGARNMAMVGVMLLAVAAAIGAHIWVTRTLQQRLAGGGTLRVSTLLDRLKLTRNWLAAAGGSAVLLTLLAAAAAAVVFPPVR